MRPILKVDDEKQATGLSQYLTSQGIENLLEKQGDTFEIWVIDEDRIDEALELVEEWRANPTDLRYHKVEKPHLNVQVEKEERPRRNPLMPGAKKMGKITLVLIILSAIFYIWGDIQLFRTKAGSSDDFFFVASPVYANLMFDYPVAYQAYAELAEKYSAEEIENPSTLPAEGKALLKKARSTPYWQGAYGEFINRYTSKDGTWEVDVPLFEQIGEGEVWRLFTPALLHGGILHIFFNVLWMLILSSQVEMRLGKWRFILFILIAGIFSNTSQYLMGGPFFFGLSGIVCALFGFIWTRQRVAPWEGYQLNRPTIIFLSIFIVAMALLQLAAFIVTIAGNATFQLGIANTAHVAGVLIGFVMGRIPLFRIQEQV